jgi:hypothetical protein
MADGGDPRPKSPRDLLAIIEAERTGLPFVYWRDGADEQHILMLTAKRSRVTIGRRDQSDIALTWDAEVSRLHALLELIGEEWTVVDDNLSRNGSFVNGSKIGGHRRLQDKDRMCFGNSLVIFRGRSEGAGSESTARAPGATGPVAITDTKRKVLIALCRPVALRTSSVPATNTQIAAEVFLSIDAVKRHLRELFDAFGIGELPQNEKRSRLVKLVLESGTLHPHDF